VRRDERSEDRDRGGALKKRFKRVSKRKPERRTFACSVLASKMKLVEARRKGDDED
jgi:hypothetical protein